MVKTTGFFIYRKEFGLWKEKTYIIVLYFFLSDPVGDKAPVLVVT